MSSLKALLEPTFTPNKNSIKWQNFVIFFWAIDVVLNIGFAYLFLVSDTLLTLSIIFFLFFYLWAWKSMNVRGSLLCGFFTVICIIVCTLSLIASILLYNDNTSWAKLSLIPGISVRTILINVGFVVYYVFYSFSWFKAYIAFRDNDEIEKKGNYAKVEV